MQKKMTGTSSLFKKLLSFYKKRIHWVIFILSISALNAWLFTLEPLYSAQILDKVIVGGNYSLLPYLIMMTVLSVLAYGVTLFTLTYVQGVVAEGIVKEIRHNYYSATQKKSFGFFDSSSVGDLVSRLTLDTSPVDMFLRGWVGTIGVATFSVITVFSVLLSINTIMALIELIPIALIVYVTNRQGIMLRPLFRKMQLILGKLGSYVQQNLIGMKVVRIFQREEEMEGGFDQIEDKHIDVALSVGRIQSIYQPAIAAIMTLGMVLIYVYAGNVIANPVNILTIGDITLFTRYLLRLSMPITNASNLEASWINASAGLERVNQIIEASVDVRDRSDAKDFTIHQGEIVFNDVSFGYSKDRPVLKNLNFRIKPGEKIAILGATGSGKTSLIYLIPRFYDVDSGSITIDNLDIRNYKIASLRKQIGLVLQDVFLFAGTIRSNIAFGKIDASMDEIIAVAKLAKIHDFIISLPEGYDSLVGERGVTLSGGQKQRLTIARTLLVNPKILILDDSLSFVDAKTENEIQAALDEAMKDRTSIIIAQRLSTIKNADRILVLDDGEIVEFGTHDELMAKGEVYKRIYETQFLEKTPKTDLVMEVK